MKKEHIYHIIDHKEREQVVEQAIRDSEALGLVSIKWMHNRRVPVQSNSVASDVLKIMELVDEVYDSQRTVGELRNEVERLTAEINAMKDHELFTEDDLIRFVAEVDAYRHDYDGGKTDKLSWEGLIEKFKKGRVQTQPTKTFQEVVTPKMATVNLCASCKHHPATCNGTPTFGTAKGNDNVIECDKHEIAKGLQDD